MNRRVGLWAVLAVLIMGAGALVVSSGGGGDDELRRLPLAFGASGRDAAAGGATAGAPEADALYWQPVTYIAGDDLPALGGSAPVMRVDGSVTEARIREIADALGLSGEVKREPVVEKGVEQWTVRDEDAGRVLEVWVGGGFASWSYSRIFGDVEPGAASGGSGSTGSGSSSSSGGTDDTVSGDVEEPVSSDAEEPVSSDAEEPARVTTVPCAVSPDGADGKTVESCEGPPVERPSDLPTQDEARTIALDLLERAGFDVGGADVRVDDQFTSWIVTAEPRVDGYRTLGLGQSVNVGPKGAIEYAGGSLASVETLGDYPMIDTRAAIERLNAGDYGGGRAAMGDVAVDTGTATGTATGDDSVGAPAQSDEPVSTDVPPDSGSTTTTAVGTDPDASSGCKVQPDGREICEDPGVIEPEPTPLPEPVPEPEPIPEPEPVDVTLTKAEVVLSLMSTWDGSAVYLVPSYEFEGADPDGNVHEPTVIAIDDEFLQPPSSSTVTTAAGSGGGQSEPGDPGADGGSTGGDATTDGGANQGATEPDPDGSPTVATATAGTPSG